MTIQNKSLAFLILFFLSSSSVYAEPGDVVMVSEAYGGVKFIRAEDQAIKVAHPGLQIHPGDMIETLANASTKILLGKSGYIELKENSKWTLQENEREGEDVNISSYLSIGELKAKVNAFKFTKNSKLQIIKILIYKLLEFLPI